MNDKVPLEIMKAGRWSSDVEFGRQILNGVNPVIIEKCTGIPANFNVTNELVAPFLTRGKSLDDEITVMATRKLLSSSLEGIKLGNKFCSCNNILSQHFLLQRARSSWTTHPFSVISLKVKQFLSKYNTNVTIVYTRV